MTDDLPNCILCGNVIMGKPTEVIEGLLCGDGMGCRRRALRDMQCRATVGLGSNGVRCEKRALHVTATLDDDETPDRTVRRHKHCTTEWNDDVPVRSK